MTKAPTWKRLNACTYRHVPTGKQVERYDPPTNGHYSLWKVEGVSGHFATRRDAQEFLERNDSE